jgi:hypothetical protein
MSISVDDQNELNNNRFVRSGVLGAANDDKSVEKADL